MSATMQRDRADALLAALVNALPEAVAITTPEGEVVEANEGFCELVGFSYTALVGRLVPLRDGFPTTGDDDPRAILGMSAWLAPVVLVCADGSHNDVLASFARLELGPGEADGFVMSVRREWVPAALIATPPPRSPYLTPPVRRVASELELAASRGELFSQYQPIVSLQTGEIQAFEALMRWNHPRHGVLGPASFLGEAEARGILADITCQIVHDACRDGAHWNELRRDGSPISVSVNLCGSQLRHPDLVESIESALATSGLAADQLWLEITENTGITEATRDPGLLQALRGIGTRIVLDDFGTGYASLGSVRKLPLDILKFDRSLVSGVASNRCDARILAAGVEMARALEIEVIAEGIENEAQMEYVAALLCHSAQGYYFSRPIDRERADLLIAQGHRLRIDAVRPIAEALGG
jgi:EAL domain-containing protein (putative c-di-GMP-specific phosphodiesterase class I)